MMFALVLAAGCGSPAPERPAAIGPCAEYAEDAAMHATCVGRIAENVATVPEARALCDKLAEADAVECRAGWAEKHAYYAKPETRDAIIAMCAGSDDCGLVLAEAWAEADPLKQIEQCGKLAGKFAADCNGHALERWMRKQPDDAERARVAASASAAPQIGYWLGISARCRGVDVTGITSPPELARRLDCPPGLAGAECLHGYEDAGHERQLCTAHSRPLGAENKPPLSRPPGEGTGEQLSPPTPAEPQRPPGSPPPGATPPPPPPPAAGR